MQQGPGKKINQDRKNTSVNDIEHGFKRSNPPSQENADLYPVLLAGGSGTRLWPVSREENPKQFARLFNGRSLLQQTIARVVSILPRKNLRIVCGKHHAPHIRRHMEETGIDAKGKIIVEPCARNTAPAVLLSILEIQKEKKNPIVFIFPADHVIRDTDAFHEKIIQARTLAEKGYIVTFGITPEYPETGYGYIEASDESVDTGFAIRNFREKPDIHTAKDYIRSGNYYWNSGIFAFSAETMLKEFSLFKPEILAEMDAMVKNHEMVPLSAYENLESISIDYAVLEKTGKAVVLPSCFGWSDIGSWKSLYDYLPKDENQNAVIGDDGAACESFEFFSKGVLLQETSHSFVFAQKRMVAVKGLSHIGVVETQDAVFVCDLEKSREVRDVVGCLKQNGHEKWQCLPTRMRSWGSYLNLESGPGYTVTRYRVYPGETLEMEEPFAGNRNIHLVSGKGILKTHEKEGTLEKGQSFSIAGIENLAIQNTETDDLVFLEVLLSESE